MVSVSPSRDDNRERKSRRKRHNSRSPSPKRHRKDDEMDPDERRKARRKSPAARERNKSPPRRDDQWRFSHHITDADRLTPPPTDRHRPDERRREERNVEGKKKGEEKTFGSEEDPTASEDWLAQKRARAPEDPTNFRSGGAYIPPAKLKRMQEQIGDKNRYLWILIKIILLMFGKHCKFIFQFET